MKNFIQRGDMITVTAPTGGVTSGQGVLVGNLFGVAAKTATARTGASSCCILPGREAINRAARREAPALP